MITGAPRVFGLDLMRAMAILLVVFSHNADSLRYWLHTTPASSGIDGVDLFFVLSGFLIGGILLKYAAMDGVPASRRLLDFWQRRWLRTLPNYYLFLALNIVLVFTGVSHGLLNHNTWGYAFFLQNLWKPVDLFFWESWSLVVEEWFYLLFPLLLFGALALLRLRARTAFLAVTCAFIVVPAVVRVMLAPDIGSVFELEQDLRKLVITRLDTIGFGMLAACLHTGSAARWRAWRGMLFFVGILGMAVNAWVYGNDALYYSTTASFTVNAIAMACLLPLLSTWDRVPWGGRSVAFISVVSYALYLVHQPLRSVWDHFQFTGSPERGLILWVLYWPVAIGIAWLVYRFWERRFMDLRDRVGRRVLGAALTPSS